MLKKTAKAHEAARSNERARRSALPARDQGFFRLSDSGRDSLRVLPLARSLAADAVGMESFHEFAVRGLDLGRRGVFRDSQDLVRRAIQHDPCQEKRGVFSDPRFSKRVRARSGLARETIGFPEFELRFSFELSKAPEKKGDEENGEESLRAQGMNLEEVRDHTHLQAAHSLIIRHFLCTKRIREKNRLRAVPAASSGKFIGTEHPAGNQGVLFHEADLEMESLQYLRPRGSCGRRKGSLLFGNSLEGSLGLREPMRPSPWLGSFQFIPAFGGREERDCETFSSRAGGNQTGGWEGLASRPERTPARFARLV